MNTESTPIIRSLKVNLSDAFDELTPVKDNDFVKAKEKYLCYRIRKEVLKNIESEEESDNEPIIRSQVFKSIKKANKRTFSNHSVSKCSRSLGNFLMEDSVHNEDKSHFCRNKALVLDSGVDKFSDNINCDLEKNVEVFNNGKSSEKLDSEFTNELSSESLSASDVMKWSDTSLIPQDSESHLSSFIKKKLFENAHNKEIIKSQTSGWTQYEIFNNQHQECNSESFYGLPTRVQQLYEEIKGIKELFSWQKDCLNLEAVKLKKNLVYSLPTSGGKSLVAEILILREILVHHKNVLLILPFVSIVQEKIRSFSQFALELNFFLEEYAAGKGVIPPKKHRKKNSLMIATIEKGLVVVNSLIEANRLEELGLIVVDELHLLSEEGRGPTLETLLIQILHSGGQIQIIGMTATIGNLEEVAKFLKAESYVGNFRPVRLLEYLKCGDKIYSVDMASEETMKEIRTLNSPHGIVAAAVDFEEDSDGIALLVEEVVPEDSVLIFCPTKKNCENISMLLAQMLSRSLTRYKQAEKTALYRALISEMNEKICPILKRTLPFGVAYHHSGLTVGERKLLEEAFRQGTLSVICCTSTLAAGVNLPAKRVILRSPYIGKNFISLSKYKQMVGRAGRTGFGSEGESFLICQPSDSEKVGNLFRSQMDETISKMNSENCKHLILSSIGLGTATTRKTLKDLLNLSLLHNQFSKLNKDTGEMVDECIDSLYKLGALKIKNKKVSSLEPCSPNELELSSLEGKRCVKITNNCQLLISRLGRAAMKGDLSLEASHELYRELLKAQASLVLLTNLHLLYLVTPYDLLIQIKPNFQIFFNIYMQLDEKETHAARIIGITESVISKLAIGAKPKNIEENTLSRFYISLILNELWNQRSVWEVAQLFQLSRGLVQTIMTQAGTFVNSVLRFCEELEEFWCFKSLLSEFSSRLSHCCVPELLPLLDLPAVKKGRAKQLYDAGFRTLQIIARAQPSDLTRALDHMPRKVASQIISAAKLLLMEKAESLQEEAENVLEGLNEKFALARI